MRYRALATAAAAVVVLFLSVESRGQQPTWDSLPRMTLERQYAGPLRDTVIQRWRDTTDGSICYLYLPIWVQHTPATESGYVTYGPNTIGSISCFAPSWLELR